MTCPRRDCGFYLRYSINPLENQSLAAKGSRRSKESLSNVPMELGSAEMNIIRGLTRTFVTRQHAPLTFMRIPEEVLVRAQFGHPVASDPGADDHKNSTITDRGRFPF